jgi:hypothetical protein
MDRDVLLCELIVISTKRMICEPPHFQSSPQQEWKAACHRVLWFETPPHTVAHPLTLRRAYLPSTEPALAALDALALKFQIVKRLQIKIGACSTSRLHRQVASTALFPATFS